MRLRIWLRLLLERVAEMIPPVWPRPLWRCDAFSEEAWKLFAQTARRDYFYDPDAVVNVLTDDRHTDVMAYRIGPNG